MSNKSQLVLTGSSLEKEVMLRDLIAKLPKKLQEIVLLLEQGNSVEQIGKLKNVCRSTAGEWVKDIRFRLSRLAKGKTIKFSQPKEAFKDEVFWFEFFKTLRETTPFETNQYEHAAELRTRNKWFQRNKS